MADSEDTYNRLVGLIYDAALDEGKWGEFLAAFGHNVQCDSSILRVIGKSNEYGHFVASTGYEASWQKAFCDYYVKVDYLTPALAKQEIGKVCIGSSLMPVNQQKTTEFYNDYLLRADKVFTMGTVIANTTDYSLQFSSQRGKKQQNFGVAQMQWMERVTPHVIRAIQVNNKISVLKQENASALSVLNHRIAIEWTESGQDDSRWPECRYPPETCHAFVQAQDWPQSFLWVAKLVRGQQTLVCCRQNHGMIRYRYMRH